MKDIGKFWNGQEKRSEQKIKSVNKNQSLNNINYIRYGSEN